MTSRTWSFGVAIAVTGGLVVMALSSLHSSSGHERPESDDAEVSSSRRSGRAPGADVAAGMGRHATWAPRPSSDALPAMSSDDEAQALALATTMDDGPLPSFEQEVERERERVAADWRAFESEARDSSWASATEQELETAIAKVETQVEGLRGRRVECRSRRCMVTLDWDSRGHTEQAMGSLIREVLVPSCGRALYLTPTPGATSNDQPYQQVISVSCPTDEA